MKGWRGASPFESLVAERLLTLGVQYGFPYLTYFLELVLLALLLRHKPRARIAGLSAYVSLLFLVDAVGRPFVLNLFDYQSPVYYYVYWLTDDLLALGALLLVSSFFRRACAKEEKLWRFTRLFLVFVLILVPGITLNSLSHNYGQIHTLFVFEFSQNLYFTCLVLNTLLYLLMQQIQCADYELGLLVCGLGIQFAGPAASFALVHLTTGQDGYEKLLQLIAPCCTLGMLLVWLYTISKAGKTVPVLAARKPGRALAAAEVRLTDIN